MSAVLEYILRTNLFNFIIFAGIIIYLCIKLDVSGKLQQGKDSVKENVDASSAAQKDSEVNLAGIESKMANLQAEVEEIISKSSENVQLVGKQIIAETNKTVKNIKDNSQKMIENKTSVLRNDILRKVSLASVEVAKNHIISELNNNNELHLKLIDESIDAINVMEGEFTND